MIHIDTRGRVARVAQHLLFSKIMSGQNVRRPMSAKFVFLPCVSELKLTVPVTVLSGLPDKTRAFALYVAFEFLPVSFEQLFHGGDAGNRTRIRQTLKRLSFTCVADASPPAEFADSAATYFPCDPRSPTRDFSVNQPS